MEHFWGIDLGGTKIEGVIIPAGSPADAVCRLRVPTEADKGYRHILDQIKNLTGLMAAETGLSPVKAGFGTPGSIDPRTGLMKNSNTACLNGKPLLQDLREFLKLEIFIENDANCFALAESIAGSAKGAASCFGVIMGTGVGGGIVINGKIYPGRHHIAGEWGHNVLIPGGPDCYCGRKGCVERIISGPALEEFYMKESGEKLPLSSIYRLFQEGENPAALRTINHLVVNFGRAIATVINILDPEVVVLGGGLSNLDILYNEGIAEVRKNVFNSYFETGIVKNMLGDSAGVFGAALLCA